MEREKHQQQNKSMGEIKGWGEKDKWGEQAANKLNEAQEEDIGKVGMK